MASFVASSGGGDGGGGDGGGGANVAMIWLCIYVRTADSQLSLFWTMSQNFGPIESFGRINFWIFGVFSAKLSALTEFFVHTKLVIKNLKNSHHASVVGAYTYVPVVRRSLLRVPALA